MKIEVKKTFFWIPLFMVAIFFTGSSVSTILGAKIDVILLLFGFLCCLIVDPTVYLSRKASPEILFIGAMAIGVLFSFTVYMKENAWLDQILFLLQLLLAYSISRRMKFSDFSRIFSSIMVWLTLISSAVLFLTSMGVHIPSFTYKGMDVGYGSLQYHSILFSSWYNDQKSIMGPFWEPGIYASMAIFAIILEGCFRTEKPRLLNILVLSIGVFLSFSTAGYILWVLAMYIVFCKNTKRSTKIWVDVLTIAICIFLFFAADYIIDLLYMWKPAVFYKLRESSMSANTRLYSPIASFLVFCKNPFTGMGLTLATEQYNLYKYVFPIDALTNTNFQLLAEFGIWGISYTIFFLRGCFRRKEFSNIQKAMFVVLTFLILNKEPHESFVITSTIIFYLNKREEHAPSL